MQKIVQFGMKRIFLIGFMGAGKTSVGVCLSKNMGLTFVDLDHYIESRYLKSVQQLFIEKGEAGFREIEQKMLREVATFEDVIISTGGGTPCFFDNMEYMKAHGTTVYLKVSVPELTNRLELCKGTRPLLKDKNKEELMNYIRETLLKRKNNYEQADVVFEAEAMETDTDVLSIANALEKILHYGSDRR